MTTLLDYLFLAFLILLPFGTFALGFLCGSQLMPKPTIKKRRCTHKPKVVDSNEEWQEIIVE